ncbi:MAG: hypothetical protein Q8P90_04785 [bacterium]|nr:hypothetical protein [bacterium]
MIYEGEENIADLANALKESENIEDTELDDGQVRTSDGEIVTLDK